MGGGRPKDKKGANKDKDEQVLLAEDHTWMKSSSDSDQEINANMVFMAQIDKVLLDSEASSSSSNYKIVEIADQEILFDKMSCQLVEMYENVRMLKTKVLKKDLKISQLEECVHNKDLEIEKCLERLNDSENKLHKIGLTNQTIHMIMPSKDLDTFSSVRRPKVSSVVWKKKGSSNAVKTSFSSVNHSNLNKNVKRYSRKDLMLCNNSHLRDTQSAYACNNARNAYCNATMNAYDDVNDLFVFDDIYLWIIDSGCSNHMMGNHALLTNFVEKFLGTVRFGNNDFAVIAGYGDVVIGSMTIKRVYYVEGLDLLTGDHSSNLYIIALNEIASNSSSCLLAKASSL
nr:hypothetical protein [Tanacetum cinerariifolium]